MVAVPDPSSGAASSWHLMLFTGSYTIFGVQPPRRVDALSYAATVAGAIVFVACAAVIFIVFNCATIPLGVFAEPIWRHKPRLRLLRLPGGIPVIAISTPVFLAIGAWHNVAVFGLTPTIAPFVATPVLALLMLGCVMAMNTLRRRLPRREPSGKP